MRIQRQQFIDSNFMRMQLTSVQKKFMHHNRYNLEITLDKQNLKMKKKYSQLKRFSQQVQKNLGVKNFSLQGGSSSRSNDQFKSIQQLVKRLNGQFLEMRGQMGEKEKLLKRQVRNYLYNMLFYNEEMVNFSDSDQEESANTTAVDTTYSAITTTISKTTLSTLTTSAASKLQSLLPQIVTAKNATNELKIDKSIKNKSMALAAQLVSTVLKKQQVQPMKQIFKNINIIWLKRDQQWHQCRLHTSQTSLILHDRHTNTKIIIILCKMTVYCCEQPYQRIILSHPLLRDTFQFRLTNITAQNQQQQQDPNISDKYLAFYSILKSLCHKQRMIETFNFIKIKINFNKSITKPNIMTPMFLPNLGSSNNIINTTTNVDKKSSKQIALKIIHHTIVSSFTLFPEYPCQITLPIVSNFGVIQLFSTQVKQSGVVPNFKQNIQNFTIPVQNIFDLLYNFKPKRKIQIQHITIQGKSSQHSLSLQYFQTGTYKTYYTCDTQNDKFQGNIQFDQPNRDELRIQFNRLKRIAWTIEQYVSLVKDWQHFTNPLQSYLFYTILVLTIVFTDMNFMLHYFIGLLIAIMIYNHPSWGNYKKQLIQYSSLTEKYNYLMMKMHSKIKGLFFGQGLIKQALKQDLQIRFKIDNEKRHFLQQFQLRMRKKRNIYKKYKRLQQILVKFQNKLMQLVNYMQKVKNIFTWYHHKKSRIVYIILLLLLFVIVFVPIRFMLLIVVYKKFKKGKKYYLTTREYNQNVINQLMSLTIKQNKLDDMYQYINNQTKLINKKDSEYQTFQKKIKQNLTNIITIEYSPKIFQLAKNIKQLKTLLSLCKKRYRIPLLTCRKYELNDKFAYKQSSLSKIIIGFISIIPSDRNILGVKASNQPQGEQKHQQNDDGKQQNDGFQEL